MLYHFYPFIVIDIFEEIFIVEHAESLFPDNTPLHTTRLRGPIAPNFRRLSPITLLAEVFSRAPSGLLLSHFYYRLWRCWPPSSFPHLFIIFFSVWRWRRSASSHVTLCHSKLCLPPWEDYIIEVLREINIRQVPNKHRPHYNNALHVPNRQWCSQLYMQVQRQGSFL